MKKNIIYLSFIGLIFFTQKSFASLSSLALTFDTNIYVYNGTNLQRQKLDQADQRIKNIIRSEEFKNRVINFTYNGVYKFVDNAGLTNSQIYSKILYAAEKLLPVSDNEMDLKIKTYYENTSTVGYTTTSSLYVNFNTKYLNSYTVAETAKTMVHEWLHKMGFTHAVTYSTSRNYSVPYGIGSIIRDLAAKSLYF
jgi:hypothetical protein